jgi:hypothetical protein
MRAVMGFRRVTLLVLIYLALDFANPMMPGAVQLVGGSLETVAGCQARGAEVPAPAVTMVRRDLSTVVPEREPILPAEHVVSASPLALVLFRAPFEPRSTPASSSDDA